ncbi:unnamed protein product, partial [Phaeothamnion confervicola]
MDDDVESQDGSIGSAWDAAVGGGGGVSGVGRLAFLAELAARDEKMRQVGVSVSFSRQGTSRRRPETTALKKQWPGMISGCTNGGGNGGGDSGGSDGEREGFYGNVHSSG